MDVINGEIAPSLVLSLVQRLPDDSMTAALVGGGEHLFGWTHERDQLANIFDAININTRATGMWEKEAPKFPPAFRPKQATTEPTSVEKPAARVADLYSRINGGI